MGTTSLPMLYLHVFKDKIPFPVTGSAALGGGGLRGTGCPSAWLPGSSLVFQEGHC